LSRQLLFPDQAPPSLQAAVKRILDSQQSGAIPATPDVFVRIGRLDRFLHNGQILADAPLAGPNGPPVVFLTIPEGIAGFTGDAVLKRVGYTASEITSSFGDSQVAALVFRYPGAVQSLAAINDDLGSHVLKRVVHGTWENLFRTFKDLAELEETPLQFEDDDRRFVASFPYLGRQRLMGLPSPSYDHLKNEGGADWVYRRCLERLLWVTPNFLGKGYTCDEDGGQGAPEYLGPNASLSSLAAAQSLAILSL
jgi:hypothetical protein